MLKRSAINTLLVFTLISAVFLSCRKEDDFETGKDITLAFSEDTLLFDTVFTTVGSTTRMLKIYNKHDKTVKISSIRLAGGDVSQFSLNINGIAQNNASDIEIEADDSLFIFVKVTVDPVNSGSPLIVKDSIIFETNGNLQDIDLVAWGRDAHYFVGTNILPGFRYPYVIVAHEGEQVSWDNDKPYVIYGYAVIDSSASLTINAGVNVHFHKNSGLWVYRYGNLEVNGTTENPVIFQGDRLEMEYDELPGQWDRILINEGGNNIISNAIIKNAFIGIQADNFNAQPYTSLEISNTQIRNMSGYGIFSLLYTIKGGNCVIADCKECTLFLGLGGNYEFRHCTFADYWNNSVRIEPSVSITNYIYADINGDGVVDKPVADLNASFGNCIFYGNLDEELFIEGDDAVAFNYAFNHCHFRTLLEITDPAHFQNCTKNEDPLFINTELNDYHPDTLSFVIDKGNPGILNGFFMNLDTDLDGKPRTSDNGPDQGAFEFIPGKSKSSASGHHASNRRKINVPQGNNPRIKDLPVHLIFPSKLR